MKIARSISRFFMVMLVLGNTLLYCTPVFAQLTVGSTALWVKNGAILSVDGLAFNPTETITLSTLQESATPITYYGASSINQVYVFSTPITFAGTLRLYYNTGALGGGDPNTLKLVYAEAGDGPLTVVEGTVVDADNGVLEYEFDDPVTLQLISAMALDATPPTVSVTTSAPNPTIHSPITVSITFSLPVLGFTADDITVSNGAVTSFSGTEAAYTAEITPAGDGQITVAISAGAAASLAGVANAALDVPLTIVYDGTPPAIPSTPTLDPVSDTGLDDADGITNNTVPTVIGTAEAGSTVTLYDTNGTTVLGTATATGGNWSIASSALSKGSHSLTATATDAAGNVSMASSALEITIDITAPAKPAVPDLAPASDSGESNSDNLTNLTDLTLQGAAGSAEALAQIQVRSSVDGGLTTTTANADGSWSLDVTALAADIHLLQVEATDVAGNTSESSDPLTVTIDNTAPTVSGVAFDQVCVTAANQRVIGFSLIGAETGSKAEYTISSSNGGTAVTASTLPVISATQQFTGIDVSELNDGTLTVSLTLVDIAGNTSTAVTGSIDKDARVPTVSGVAIAEGNYTEADVISITITLDEDVTVSGTGSTLTLNIGGTIRQAAFASESAGVLLYQYTVQPGDHTDATGVIVATDGIALNGDVIRDAYGNDAALTFAQTGNADARVDTEAPATPVVVSPATAVTVNADEFTISGTHGENGVTVSLYLDADNDGVADNATVMDAAVIAGGTWSLTAVLAADADNNFVVIAEDAMGNRSEAADVFTISEDSQPPAAPSQPDLLAGSDTGISDSDNLTNSTTPTFTGTAEAYATVELFAEAVSIGIAIADGSGNWSITSNTLMDGGFAITATATDGVGNTSGSSDPLTVMIDNTAPTVSGVAIADGNYTEADVISITIMLDEDVTVSGAGSSLTLNIGAAVRQAVFASESAGVLLYQYTVQPGDHTGATGVIVAADGIALNGDVIRDVHGNDAALAFAQTDNADARVDAEAPAAPSQPHLLAGSDTGISDRDNLTNSTTPTFTGTAEAYATVELFAEAVSVGTTTADGGGNWSITTGELSAGSHNLAATATDLIGNVSALSVALTIIIDNEAPILSITGMGNDGLYTGDVTAAFNEGTATLNGDPFTSGTVVTESDVYELVVTDAAGNVATANFIIDKANKPQEITFDVPAGLKYGDDPVALTALATSGLPVVYTVTDREGNKTNVATVENNELYIHAAGELLITAAQEGDTEYAAATPVGRVLVIGKAPLNVTASPKAKVYGTADPALTYTHSGLVGEDGAETFVGSLTRASGEDVGSYTIASGTLSAGDNYEITFSGSELTIMQATRTLDFPPLPAKTYGDGDFNAVATVSSAEAITYTSSDPSVAEVTTAGLLRVTGAGQATITATVAANANYTTRPRASQTLVVRKATQSITFNAPADVNRDAGTVQLDVTASSGLPISLTIDDEQVATLSGMAFNVLRLGTVRITATQPGDANHEAAEPVAVAVRVIDPSAALPVRVHKAVSPNGDGINEFLMIEAIKDYPENRVRIFNRNGTVVWEASGYNNGTVAFRGIGTGQLKVPAGTYFYVAEIRVDGEWKYEKGWFVLRY